MSRFIEKLLQDQVRAVASTCFAADGTPFQAETFQVERPREESHGDFATNFALLHARALRRSPKLIADQLAEQLQNLPILESVAVAGPGFINMRLNQEGWSQAWKLVADRAVAEFPCAPQNGKLLVEFVSANPTGPLHVGHGRGAAVGDSLVRLLRRAGWTVDAEYYVNDAGLQIEILGRSVRARARQMDDQQHPFPEDGYKGAYIGDMASAWKKAGEPGGEDDQTTGRWAGEVIRKEIEEDLQRFRVSFDRWYSEFSLYEGGMVDTGIERLVAAGATYKKDGALWFASSRWGDEKDRVLIRSNGVKTYFASDVAYHLHKFERGYARLIDIWGADHHGYIPRVRAALQALGYSDERLQVLLIQFVSLVHEGQPVQMSTRGGTFETLADLVEETGADAARYFYLLRKPDNHLEFDLELAKRQSSDNPVYYVMYAHARSRALLRKCEDNGLRIPCESAVTNLQPAEKNLLLLLDDYDTLIVEAAQLASPHLIVNYLGLLAAAFHKFYTDCPILTADTGVVGQRLLLADWVRMVLADGLQLVGVQAPDSM